MVIKIRFRLIQSSNFPLFACSKPTQRLQFINYLFYHSGNGSVKWKKKMHLHLCIYHEYKLIDQYTCFVSIFNSHSCKWHKFEKHIENFINAILKCNVRCVLLNRSLTTRIMQICIICAQNSVQSVHCLTNFNVSHKMYAVFVQRTPRTHTRQLYDHWTVISLNWLDVIQSSYC